MRYLGFCDLVDTDAGHGTAHKEVHGHRRRHKRNGQRQIQNDAEVDWVAANLRHNRQQRGSQNDDGGSGLDEHPHEEHDDENHEHDHIVVIGDAEQEVGDDLVDMMPGSKQAFYV